MVDKKSQLNQTFDRAIYDYNNGRFEEAAKEAAVSLKEASEPAEKAAALYVQGNAEASLCYAQEKPANCDTAEKNFQEMLKEASLCKSGGKIGKYVYDCVSLKMAARKFISDVAQLRQKVIEHSSDQSAETILHTTTNVRDPKSEQKTDWHISSFTPPLTGANYIREHVFNAYDKQTNHWLSHPSNFSVYDKTFPATHHYDGFAAPQQQTFLYYADGDLLVLPVPDDFTIDAKSVRLDGKNGNFDLVQDEQGIVYAKLRERVWSLPKVSFDMKRQQTFDVTPPTEAMKKDLLPELSLPSALAGLRERVLYFGAQEKFEAVKRYIFSEMRYPEMRDILNGKAVYPEEEGKLFYEAVTKTKLADCDVANSYAVLVLRKLGVAARLVTGLLVDERGVGGHGWLEYWDEERSKWVQGDVTPPSEEKNLQRTEKSKDPEEDKRIGFPFRLMKKEMHPASATSVQDTSLFFGGNVMMLSNPEGRYLLAWSEDYQYLEAYDLEYDHFLPPIHFPFPALSTFSISPAHFFETATGFVFKMESVDGSLVEKGIHFVYLNQNGEILWKGDQDNRYWLESKFPPYISTLKIPSDFWVTDQMEDLQGRFHIFLMKGEPKVMEEFQLVLPPQRADNKVVEIKESDLQTPQIFAPILTGRIRKRQITPDGRYTLVKLESGLDLRDDLVLFDDGRLKYRRTLDNRFESDAKLRDDGSVAVKIYRSKDEAIVYRLDLEGGEEPGSRIRWFFKEGFVSSEKEVWREYGNVQERISMIPYSTKFDVYDWNGEWAKIVFENDFLLGYATTLGAPFSMVGPGRKSDCEEGKDLVRCLNIFTRVLSNPFDVSPSSLQFKIPQEDPWFSNHTEIERGHTKFWDLNRYEQTASKESCFHNFGLIDIPEPPAVAFLKSTFGKKSQAPIVAANVRQALKSVADHSQDYLHPDWLLLSAAWLYDQWSLCENVTEIPLCAAERKEASLFFNATGPLLSERLMQNIRKSSYFPNSKIVAKGWAAFLKGSLNGKEPARLLEAMITADADKAAEAVLSGIEANLFDAKDLPTLSFSKMFSLSVALKKALEERRKIVIVFLQTNRFNTDMNRLPLFRYQTLENAIAQHFGSTAIPKQLEKDW